METTVENKYYVYYEDRGYELVYTWFSTLDMANFAAKQIGGYVKP